MHNGGRNEKYTFRFENISFRFMIVEHFVLLIISDLHLCIIGQLHTKDFAKDYWHEVKNDNITINDWFVLWGEMVRRNDGKIKKWFG